MIEMINDLINKGFAYENKKHVYFEVKKFKDYGKLSNKNLDDLIAGSRVEILKIKKIQRTLFYGNHLMKDEPAWDSPWGKGRPGWHLRMFSNVKKIFGR